MPGELICCTKNDWVSSISRFEAKFRVCYVDMDYRIDGKYPTYDSVLSLPYLGTENAFSAPAGRDTLVLPADNCTFVLQEIPQFDGTVSIKVEAEDNRHGFTIQFGGFNHDGLLLGGRIGYYGDDPNALELYKACRKEVCSELTIIKDWYGRKWYVGPEALEFLKNGGRIITGSTTVSDTLEDLKLPANMK